jgi:two-component system, chemotaxis family, protein-glutamate methylesterase/glutaminase
MNPEMRKVRVLVVDDSALMRKVIPQMLEADPLIEVVGTAMDGTFCLKKIEELQPHVVTLALQMPAMNGIETLKEIMRRHPLPVIVVSSHSTDGASVTLKALGLGAFDFVAKPRDATGHMAETAHELIAKIKAAAGCKLVRPGFSGRTVPPLEKLSLAKAAPAPSKLVAIGISTGGPQALEFLLAQLPPSFPGTIVVVQHMPENFTEMFARRLDELCSLRVKEAQSGDVLQAGRVLICPGNRHIKVKRLPQGDVVVLNDEARVNGHRPSVDVLFRSVATEFGSQAVAALMTGMGDDGAEGLGAIKKAGGVTIAQSEESCVVFGMPKAAIERGYATRVLALENISTTLLALCGRTENSGQPRQEKEGGSGKAAGL